METEGGPDDDIGGPARRGDNTGGDALGAVKVRLSLSSAPRPWLSSPRISHGETLVP